SAGCTRGGGSGLGVVARAGRSLGVCWGGIAVIVVCHCHPALVGALTEQTNHRGYVSNFFTNVRTLRLAKNLVDATFAERVFFCNPGAEANEAAFKLARRGAHDQYGPVKYAIIAALNSLHGRTPSTFRVCGPLSALDGSGPYIERINHRLHNYLAALPRAGRTRTS
ncbi:aminotransferase class III-fold pyridoxal phosphate-dependent enzyme, partial [Pseudomonas syringae]